jgi:hypothetical protein
VRSRRLVSLITAITVVALLAVPAEVLAQRRWHGHGHPRVLVGFGYYPFYSPYYWHSFYSPFWGPWYWPPYAYGSYASEVRIMATPREAEVYVDGYLVGTVDDFDGWSQRLRLQPGEHEIELFLDGYRSVRQKMLLRPGETYKIRATLEKADPTEAPATRPTPAPDPRDSTAAGGPMFGATTRVSSARSPSAPTLRTPSSWSTASGGTGPKARRGCRSSSRPVPTTLKYAGTATGPTGRRSRWSRAKSPRSTSACRRTEGSRAATSRATPQSRRCGTRRHDGFIPA